MTIFHAQIRNGATVRYRKMDEKDMFSCWTKMGWFRHDYNTFGEGDPELWQESGAWREDGQESEFDIVKELGIEQSQIIMLQ
jgi:hypothetical protein